MPIMKQLYETFLKELGKSFEETNGCIHCKWTIDNCHEMLPEDMQKSSSHDLRFMIIDDDLTICTNVKRVLVNFAHCMPELIPIIDNWPENTGRYTSDSIEINYCPWCGRKLTED